MITEQQSSVQIEDSVDQRLYRIEYTVSQARRLLVRGEFTKALFEAESAAAEMRSAINLLQVLEDRELP